MKLLQTKDYLLLIDEGATTVKYGDYIYRENFDTVSKYINDNPEKLWQGCHKIVAYHPLNSEAKELDLPWLPPFEEDRKEFIPEYEEIPNFERSMGNIHENYKYQIKTTTNSSGKIELVGTYKY